MHIVKQVGPFCIWVKQSYWLHVLYMTSKATCFRATNQIHNAAAVIWDWYIQKELKEGQQQTYEVLKGLYKVFVYIIIKSEYSDLFNL